MTEMSDKEVKATLVSLPEGTVLKGTYRVVRFIGSGGFGCTYEAIQLGLDERVAVKEFFVRDFCNRDGATAHVTVGTESKRPLVEKLMRKFVSEAKTLSRIRHSGIVRVRDVFSENGTVYYVMDYVGGGSLADLISSRGRLGESEALGYIRQISAALVYVHTRNILHLDIKPGNIMIDEGGKAVLIDFGAAKQYDEEKGENTSTLMGKTRGYAPLEQMDNNVSTFQPATDIYALGATLYKMLTGVTPPSSSELASEEETLAPLPAYISAPTRDAVAAAMRLSRKKRPQTVAEFLAILDAPEAGPEDDKTEIDDPQREPEAPRQPEPIPRTESRAPSKARPTLATTAKDKTVGIVVAVFIVCAVGVKISSALRKGGGTPVDNGETWTAVNAVTDMSYTNSKGVSFVYTGDVNGEGAPDGTGTGVYSDGTYKGEYAAGLRHGNAVYDTKDGINHFEGTYADDMYSEGTLTWHDDDSFFKGTFKDNNVWNGKYVSGGDAFTVKNGEYTVSERQQ